MDKKLYVGFKGTNNASCILVNHLCDAPVLLTNSFSGVKRDIEQLDGNYECVFMFGIDKNLKDTVRIESVAEKDGCRLCSDLKLEDIAKHLEDVGISNYVSNVPTHYLCNEAYWFALKKYNGKVVFVHIPTAKNINKEFLRKMKLVFA